MIATKENVTKAEVDNGVADLQKAVVTFEAGKVPVPTKIALKVISELKRRCNRRIAVATTGKWLTLEAKAI